MTDYTKATNFAVKDGLPSGNPAKLIKGTEIDTEFNAIQTSIATKGNIGTDTTYNYRANNLSDVANVTTARTNLGAEASANKDASGGYAGLTLFKINFKNVANTFTSFFTNSNTAPRTYTFKDSDGVIADQTSLTGSSKLPVGTVAQRDVAPAAGYFRFNSDYNQFEGYNGSGWGSVGGAVGGAGNPAFYENDITISQNYTITTNKNAMSAGPVTVNNGVTVTVPTGSVWSVI